MGGIIQKPYEISIWEDRLSSDETHYEEVKLMIIGSDTMTSPYRVYDPVLTENVNGEKTLTFSLLYRYYDELRGKFVLNPYYKYLINERKIKLHYNDEWFEFLIKECEESSEDFVFQYTARELFSLELSKGGYGVTLDASLNNNQGTVIELAEKVLENTDWEVDKENSDLLQQFVQDPLYKCTAISGFTVLNLDTNEDENIAVDEVIYVFYSYLANNTVTNVQFIRENDRSNFIIDDDNIIKSTNYRFKEDISYVITEDVITGIKLGDNTVINVDSIFAYNQGYRLVYGQQTTYDPIKNRTVDLYQTEYQDSTQDIYHYKDYEYSTSEVVTSYVTSGTDFGILDNGDVQGWSNMTQVSGSPAVLQPIQLTTYPELSTTSKLISVNKISEVTGYIKLNFNDILTSNYSNTYFNSGFNDNISLINHISTGERFALRVRYYIKDAETGLLVPGAPSGDSQGIRAIVARYTTETKEYYLNEDAETPSTVEIYKISPGGIILNFNQNFEESMNVINSGTFDSNGSDGYYTSYIVDDVVQTPSSLYCYKAADATDNSYYVWDSKTQKYIPKEDSNYASHYITTARAQIGYSNEQLSDQTLKLGIFIYIADSNLIDKDIYLQDIQLTRYYEDSNGEPILVGNTPKASSIETDYYYLKPKEGMTDSMINTYESLEFLASELGVEEDSIVPIFNENCEKILSIQAQQSNYFNILQSLCETFECWLQIDVEHEDDGKIKLDENGKQIKRVAFKEYAGKDNFSGFKRGINLTQINRSIDSNEIVTKLIVNAVQSEYTDEGSVAIEYAKSNPSGESYIINLSYFLNRGLITDVVTCNQNLQKFYTDLKNVNNQIQAKSQELSLAQLALTKIKAKRNDYTALLTEAQEQYNEAIQTFFDLTKVEYEEYVSKYQNVDEWARDDAVDPDLMDNESVLEQIATIYTAVSTKNSYSGILTNIEEQFVNCDLKCNGAKTYSVSVTSVNNTVDGGDYVTKVVFDDYVPNVRFQLIDTEDSYVTYTTSANERIFEITNANPYCFIVFNSIPNNYQLKYYNNNTVTALSNTVVGANVFSIYDTVESKTLNRRFQLVPLEEYADKYKGLSKEIEELTEQKKAIEKEFYKKYSRFLQEGTWNSQDYINSELYYLDALQVSNTSAQPQVSYTINVIDVNEQTNLENYNFHIGDKTFIEDTEFFGYLTQIINVGSSSDITDLGYEAELGFQENDSDYLIVQTPVQEEVIISNIEWHLDSPDENVITIQNYKTQFEDLFQRISAAVQTVQRNEITYPKTTSIIDANGLIESSLLADSMAAASSLGFGLTTNGSIESTNDGFLFNDLANSNNKMRLTGRGLQLSTDGGQTWVTAINAEGIKSNALTAGTINTQEILLMDGSSPSFRWDKSGLNAYGFNEDGSSAYDLKTYVRFDKYGLYGIKDGENYVATSLDDIKDKAHFGVTWDGFFIKNSYTDGYVSITSDNDFQVIQEIDGSEVEKIKIGALEFNADGEPTKYGINIKDNAGNVVFTTGDNGDITITGTINAAAGNIGGMTVNDNSLTMDTIVLEPGVGIYSTVLTEGNNQLFNISDVDGSATFQNISALGGELGNLTVIDTITVGDGISNGTIQSSGFVTGTSGWAIKSDGTAEFQDAIVRGEINATSGTLSNLDINGGINIAQNGYIKSSNWNNTEGNEAGWKITNTTATFNDVIARGHIEALTGTLGLLTVQDTITVGDSSHSGIIQSNGYTTGVSGWAIKSDGSAEFQNATVRGHIDANSGTLNNLSITGGITVNQNGYIQSNNFDLDNQTGWKITDSGATFNNVVARGHIEAATGTLGDLDVIDTITVGANGAIESSNYSANDGWHIDTTRAVFNNATVRGEVNAGSGNFYGNVTVGANSPYINIDGSNAEIYSSNYQGGAGYGWMINSDGDAVFNNITARGAIKTAVFEYAEIQAVGGIFIFRPSSTIKSARINGNNLILKVEKPALFAKAVYTLSEDTTVDSSKTYYTKGNYGYSKVQNPTGNPQELEYYEMDTQFQSWCKISNYTTDGTEPNVNNILLSNGLTHVYKVLNVDLSTAEVTLENGAQFINSVIQQDQTVADVLTGLEGGALVDMGREDGSSNYGIGVNSSDNTVNLPRRAISLFETVIDPEKSPKVSYKYKGILGTLPELPTTDVNNSIYNSNMAGTQGIFTDNMYIGDKDQYVAFYTDEEGKKHLKIKAKEFIREYNSETGEEQTWEDYISEIETTSGPPGPAGQDAIRVEIDPVGGNFIKRGQTGTSLIAHVYEGINDITNQFSHFTWYRRKSDGTRDTSWSTEETSNQLSITTADIDETAVFVCEVTVTR